MFSPLEEKGPYVSMATGVNKYAWPRLENLLAFLSLAAAATFPATLVAWPWYDLSRAPYDKLEMNVQILGSDC